MYPNGKSEAVEGLVKKHAKLTRAVFLMLFLAFFLKLGSARLPDGSAFMPLTIDNQRNGSRLRLSILTIRDLSLAFLSQAFRIKSEV
jgi:hypothetical protein